MAFNPKYTIKLSQVFNRAYRGESASLKRQLRQNLTSRAFKAAFSLQVINEIRKNTKSGLNKNGKPYTGAAASYSKGYRESLEFKIYKGSGSSINMTLTGDMLASIVSKQHSDSIVFEFMDQENKNKAHGHITGFNRKNLKKRRDFFGLPPEKEAEILRRTLSTVTRFRGELPASSSRTVGQEVRVSNQGQVTSNTDIFSDLFGSDTLFGGDDSDL